MAVWTAEIWSIIRGTRQMQQELALTNVTQKSIAHHWKLLIMIQNYKVTHLLVPGNETSLQYDNPHNRKLYKLSGHTSTLLAKEYSWKKLCCVFGGISLVYYLMSCLTLSNQCCDFLYNTIEKFERRTKEKTTPVTTKLFSCMEMVGNILRRRSKHT